MIGQRRDFLAELATTGVLLHCHITLPTGTSSSEPTITQATPANTSSQQTAERVPA